MKGGGTENTRLEKSGLENVEPNRRGGKDGTGKHGTKAHGWKSQDWKTRDQISRGVEKAGLINAGTSCAWVAKCNCQNTACRNSTKICVGNYVGDIYHRAKFHSNRFRCFGSAHA